ncbi:MAG: PKD domain-containing protein [Bacteroidales bacterium]|nr:PKD domain-containing protein [Bacteroidales bacterium]
MGQFKYLSCLVTLFALTIINSNLASQTKLSYKPIVVDAGDIIVTYVNSNTSFVGNAFSIDGATIIKYEWDFNGDGKIDYSSKSKNANYFYKSEGNYEVKLIVTNSNNETNFDIVQVQVKPGGREQKNVKQQLGSVTLPTGRAADGINNGRAVLINGGYEQQFWDETIDMYTTLKNVYCFSDNDIILLNHNGTNPSGNNPNGIIDYAATYTNLQTVFNNLASTMDSDDVLFVWYTDHGGGYCGPNIREYGTLSTRATVESGDEQDYVESNFKLRSFYNGITKFGMDIWKEFIRWSYQASTQTYKYRCFREKFVSNYNIYLDNGTHVVDNDIYIEHIIDYTLGDYNRDGWIDSGETMDLDGNGIYDDWGLPDIVEDNYNTIPTKVPGANPWSYIIFDRNFDNRLDIDINPVCTIVNCTESQLVVDGTDSNNDGLFDGIDANEDGDQNDWISIDETLCIYGGIIYDDELKALLSNIPSSKKIIIISACMSGGFVDDLSAPGRVIITAEREEYMGIMGAFMPPLTEALKNPSVSDLDNNGLVSMKEAFNYAAAFADSLGFQFNLYAQYDDNGDMISHVAPIPNGNDGSFGSTLYINSVLLDNISLQNLSITTSSIYNANDANISNVSIQNSSNVEIHALGTTTITNIFGVDLGSTLKIDNIPKCQSNAIDEQALEDKKKY